MFGIVPVIWLCLISRAVNLVRPYISEGKEPVMNCFETLKCPGKTIVREIQRNRNFAHFSYNRPLTEVRHHSNFRWNFI